MQAPDAQSDEGTRTSGPVVVTGAAGGIGRATVELLRAGSRPVIATDLDTPALAELGSNDGVEAIPCDLADAKATQAFAEDLAARHSSVAGLVHAAGTGPSAPVERMSDEEWSSAVEIHLSSAFRLCRPLVPVMGEGSSIVLISSTSIYGSRYMASYSAAKAGMIGFTKALAIELGPLGIRANVVAPGPIDTPLLRTGPPEWIEKLPSRIPLGRIGEPREIADVADFLLSERSSFVTGQCIVADGGFTLGG